MVIYTLFYVFATYFISSAQDVILHSLEPSHILRQNTDAINKTHLVIGIPKGEFPVSNLFFMTRWQHFGIAVLQYIMCRKQRRGQIIQTSEVQYNI
jgi:hypothetical protein